MLTPLVFTDAALQEDRHWTVKSRQSMHRSFHVSATAWIRGTSSGPTGHTKRAWGCGGVVVEVWLLRWTRWYNAEWEQWRIRGVVIYEFIRVNIGWSWLIVLHDGNGQWVGWWMGCFCSLGTPESSVGREVSSTTQPPTQPTRTNSSKPQPTRTNETNQNPKPQRVMLLQSVASHSDSTCRQATPWGARLWQIWRVMVNKKIWPRPALV